MARDVPLTNIYNMSANNWSPNNHLTNTVGESKSVTDGQSDSQTRSIDKLLLGAKKSVQKIEFIEIKNLLEVKSNSKKLLFCSTLL